MTDDEVIASRQRQLGYLQAHVDRLCEPEGGLYFDADRHDREAFCAECEAVEAEAAERKEAP